MVTDNYYLNRGINMVDSRFGIRSFIEDSIFDGGFNFIKSRYGEEIYITNCLREANEWIKKYDKKFSERSKDEEDLLLSTKFMIDLPDKNTFAYVQVGGFNSRSLVIYNNAGEVNRANSSIKMYIFGKKYAKYIEELRSKLTRKDDTELYIYDIKGYSSDHKEDGVDSVGRVMHKRDINSLYYNPGIKEEIFAHIDSFFENKELYASRDLTYKTGILLYGEPGTGKTSLASALATKYNRNLILLDLNTFANLDIGTLTACINADSDKYIVLLEDIDVIFPNLNRDSDEQLDENSRKVINKMLQFLDSQSSPNDVIFIATTNHYEKLDKAILRDGRFDIKIEISLINETEAIEMIKSFEVPDSGVKSIIDEISKSENSKMKDGVLYVNPSELQNKILAYFKNERKMEVTE